MGSRVRFDPVLLGAEVDRGEKGAKTGAGETIPISSRQDSVRLRVHGILSRARADFDGSLCCCAGIQNLHGFGNGGTERGGGDIGFCLTPEKKNDTEGNKKMIKNILTTVGISLLITACAMDRKKVEEKLQHNVQSHNDPSTA